MPTQEQIRNALAASLSTIPGLQATGYMMSSPTLPHAYVTPSEIDYLAAMGGVVTGQTYALVVLVGLGSDIGAQKLLDRMLEPVGEMSVKAAVEADKTLGGVIDAVIVTRASGYRLYAREGSTPALGCEWTVEVLT
jgi:hypothetical protein